ncbi:MAG: acylneuraminate cytidylyltransferase family protein [Crenarchaeota archaeon]|nr:MAG: acylneuraminate cytidylyltransferase family protein [Thermoproteota archaeon]RDJ33312.1 MAG: acylneuraminate cytidylyltransferase family protein [Thermoproteota archaeon]RDJ36185.1 MAG: acylneuraminate cytidylyltransferase family protein [Thermoproteota archaeon]RDJ38816.1 MAG: acylneuraminate cytidylyltransferase family protein [Thermoproteota archaeon]
MKMTKPICFIGARGGSKGVPKKNIRIIKKKPLIAYTIEKAINSKFFSHVIVSTEDPEIAKISKKFGAEIPFIRPKKLATNKASMEDALIDGIKKLYSMDFDFEIVVLLDCTVPFLRITDIKKAVTTLQKKNADVVCGVYRQHLNPYFNIAEINKKGHLQLCKKLKKIPENRQDAPIVYQMNGLYVFNAKNFLKKGKKIMQKMIPCEIPLETGLMIDTEFEFNLAKLILENKKN